MKKKYLFVSGVPRSGTTVLTNILNSHSKIFIGIERYKKLMHAERFEKFTPELFELDRLLDFSDGYTNHTPEVSPRLRSFYLAVKDNYSEFIYLGDKVPNNHRFIDAIHNKFEGSKTIFIVRNIFDTACSWQARAEREGDTWPESKTAVKAIHPWNKCNQKIIKMVSKYPLNCLVIGYESFFDENNRDLSEIDRITGFLNLERESGLARAYANAREKYTREIKGKERVLAQEYMREIKSLADFEQYKEVQSHFNGPVINDNLSTPILQ